MCILPLAGIVSPMLYCTTSSCAVISPQVERMERSSSRATHLDQDNGCCYNEGRDQKRGRTINQELQALYEQDQADRRTWEHFDQDQIQQVLQQDRLRRQRVEELLASEELQAPEDYFHAAMIFQHGETLEHFWQAHELAKRGAALGHPICHWLAAAAYDRWLMNQGKPQKYGTQYITREGRWMLYEVDPTTSDTQRMEWNVPPLAQSLQRAEEMNHIPHSFVKLHNGAATNGMTGPTNLTKGSYARIPRTGYPTRLHCRHQSRSHAWTRY